MTKRWINRACVIIGSWCAYAIAPTLLQRLIPNRRVHKRATGEAIYVTFDDGPHPIYTAQLLHILKRYEAKATFFVVGEYAQASPHLIRQMHEDGHTIGIHHMHHRSSWQLSPRALRAEIEQCAAVIETITGERPTLYRPPWGHFNIASRYVTPLPFVLWTRLYYDWRLGYDLSPLYTSPPQNGDIVLLHDHDATWGADIGAPEQTIQAVERLLHEQQHRTFHALSLEVLR